MAEWIKGLIPQLFDENLWQLWTQQVWLYFWYLNFKSTSREEEIQREYLQKGTDLTSCLSSASNVLPEQQMFGKSSRYLHVSKAKPSQLHIHLPSFPSRQSIRRPLLSVATQDNPPRQHLSSQRGGGTGRREAVSSSSRDTPRTSSNALFNPHSTHEIAISRSVTRTFTRSRTETFRESGPKVSWIVF